MPGGAREPGRTGHPGQTGGVAVSVRACVGARRRSAWSLGPGRPSPAAERILPGGTRGLSRTRLIPRSSPSPRGARRLRAVRAIGARRDPAPVRQPVLAAGHRSAVRRAPVHGAAVDGAAVHGAAVHAGRRSWGRRSWGRRSWGRRSWGHRSAGSRQPGWPTAAGSGPAGACASGPARGIPAGAAFRPVAAVAARTRRRRHPARSGPRRRPAGRRGGHPGVFAWACRRHRGPGRCRHVPPGTSWTLLSSRAAGTCLTSLMSVGREKSPVRPRRSIVINCT